ncbi:MobC family plasmid mobilization relaxosome protein [Mucilaginibacter sp. HC2]|uniref:plasmid mobilization protein n=1 Tax=Mucilaginibacter inviolabilis TaxID=2714892 RepID=UPI0014075203|nr:plasmid mobilization relaxosome protein MobC [Mucilaginibacter inviolabilis]NHA03276.1 MobC family plasmid mobilization relaxosome protein [Mucilaginibacter inviolabilis]
MVDFKKPNGRPKLKEGRRTNFINVRFTDVEYKEIADLEQQLGVSKTDLIRMRILTDAKRVVINSKELIKNLDGVGAELGRVGNNINQLAKHANILKLQGQLSPLVIKKFNELFEEHIIVQQTLEAALRSIIRAMGQ